jgi:hypothetical protein
MPIARLITSTVVYNIFCRPFSSQSLLGFSSYKILLQIRKGPEDGEIHINCR